MKGEEPQQGFQITGRSGRHINWHTIRRYLEAGNYERIAMELYHAQQASDQPSDALVASLLDATRQLCLACSRINTEVDWYLSAHNESAQQAAEMQDALRNIINLLGGVSNDELSMTLQDKPINTAASNGSNGLDKILHFIQNLSGKRFNPPAKTTIYVNNAHFLTVDAGKTAALSTPPPSDLPAFKVYCLGAFRVYQDDCLINDWPSRRGKSILKYLLLHRNRSVAKEVLMELFWPEADPEAARNNLNVAIYGLRQALRDSRPNFSHIVFQDGLYMLNSSMHMWVDVEAFMVHFRTGRDYEQQGQPALACREYALAESLYQGELFEDDRYEDWILPKRQTLQDHYLTLLNALSGYYLEQENYPACIAACKKLLDVEPCLEVAHRHLMRCYSRQGQRYLAMRQYRQCEEMLLDMLDVPPTRQTSELYELIQRDQYI